MMKIKKNGKKSCGDKSRCIHIRYFFIKDNISEGKCGVNTFPTERMISDFYIKPLHGSLFRKMRDIIMGLTPFPEEECVINSEKIERKLTENID